MSFWTSVDWEPFLCWRVSVVSLAFPPLIKPHAWNIGLSLLILHFYVLISVSLSSFFFSFPSHFHLSYLCKTAPYVSDIFTPLETVLPQSSAHLSYNLCHIQHLYHWNTCITPLITPAIWHTYSGGYWGSTVQGRALFYQHGCSYMKEN